MALPGSVTIPTSAAETGWRPSPCAAAGPGGDRLLHDSNGTRPRGRLLVRLVDVRGAVSEFLGPFGAAWAGAPGYEPDQRVTPTLG